ncbi:4Fe-4S binding protein [bacterium]|nr:4Fe-4S binding protein [bacterium]
MGKISLRHRIGRKGLKTYSLRLAVQSGFAILIMLIGLEFARFVHAIETGVSPLPSRPSGVEGFLPISGLMGVLDWIYQGKLNSIHPAATMLFLIFTVSALLLRKNFCSWICPVGLISETLARIGRRVFGRNFRPWRWLDEGLRSIKYLLLGFFAWAIFTMSADALREFITSGYNRISDVKMYYFFAHLSSTSIVVLVVLTVGSVFINGFWCRYLCPYGAWLGIFSWTSPVKIRRNEASCTDCGLCDRVCMARLPVSKKERIISPECTGCLDCVASCPSSTALTAGGKGRKIGVEHFAAGVFLVFMLGYLVARVAGWWEGGVSESEYFQLHGVMESLDHLGQEYRP